MTIECSATVKNQGLDLVPGPQVQVDRSLKTGRSLDTNALCGPCAFFILAVVKQVTRRVSGGGSVLQQCPALSVRLL